MQKMPEFFDTKEEFDNHYERMHIRKLFCMECGKQFVTKSNLSSHLKLLHSKSSSDPGNALICPFDNCWKRFIIKPKYQDHLSLHSGLKPHSCLKCGKRYWNRYSKKIMRRFAVVRQK
jgi:KRAB domain-containing zinc finger protein